MTKFTQLYGIKVRATINHNGRPVGWVEGLLGEGLDPSWLRIDGPGVNYQCSKHDAEITGYIGRLPIIQITHTFRKP